MSHAIKTITKLRSGEDVSIVAIGDSLTQGWMVSKGYVDFLEEMIKAKYPESRATIINRGIPGDTAQGGLYRLEYDVISHNPDLTLIQFALNDLFIGYPVKQFSNYMQTMIEKIKNDTESEILLVTSVPLESIEERRISLEFYRIIKELASQYNTVLAEVHTYWENKIAAGINPDRLVQDDRVHPTVEGYKLMAEAIIEVL